LKGRFTPHHAENGYTWVEGESADERVIASYSQDVVVRSGEADKPVVLVNATGAAGMLADLSAKPAKIELFDVFGRSQGDIEPQFGLVRMPIPASGYAVIKFTDNEGKRR
jgi:hypothetical protein